MILVCGGLADSVTEVVCARLADAGYAYRFLDLAVYPSGYEVSWQWTDRSPTGHISTAEWTLDLADISGAFVRFVGPEGRRQADGIAPEFRPAMDFELHTGLMALIDDLPCVVVNRIAGGLSNNSKPYQALLVREVGLLTPPTLVTNDPAAAREFIDEFDGDVVYKSLSGIRSIVRRIGPEMTARLPFLRHGPAQFQRYIPGTNIRVHTVGHELFATRVASDAVDYRYARREGATVEMEPTTLPPSIEESCHGLAAALGLELAGIDLKVTPEGEFYCFEANPSPGFLYYEQHTRQPISAAVADLLHHGRATTGSLKEVPMA